MKLNKKGFTLIETIVGVAVLVIALSATTYAIVSAYKVGETTQSNSQARNFAQSITEEIKGAKLDNEELWKLATHLKGPSIYDFQGGDVTIGNHTYHVNICNPDGTLIPRHNFSGIIESDLYRQLKKVMKKDVMYRLELKSDNDKESCIVYLSPDDEHVDNKLTTINNAGDTTILQSSGKYYSLSLKGNAEKNKNKTSIIYLESYKKDNTSLFSFQAFLKFLDDNKNVTNTYENKSIPSVIQGSISKDVFIDYTLSDDKQNELLMDVSEINEPVSLNIYITNNKDINKFYCYKITPAIISKNIYLNVYVGQDLDVNNEDIPNPLNLSFINENTVINTDIGEGTNIVTGNEVTIDKSTLDSIKMETDSVIKTFSIKTVATYKSKTCTIEGFKQNR